MICPYCQHDLEVEILACPRCFAAYPRAARPFGFGLRITAAAGAMLFVGMMILSQVFSYLPGGARAVLPAGSKVYSGTQAPDFHSADVDRQLGRWAASQQNADHALPGFVHR